MENYDDYNSWLDEQKANISAEEFYKFLPEDNMFT
jgi:hypothetical protein